MIKILTAGTNEIDHIEYAVSEICAQLNIKDALLKNSVGLLQCFSEYIDSGVIAALSDALPFPIVGGNTLASATQSFYGQTALSLFVLTSDTNEFDVHVLPSIATVGIEEFSHRLRATAAGRQQKPSMILLEALTEFSTNSGQLLHAFEEVMGPVPIFGNVPVAYVGKTAVSRITVNQTECAQSIAFVVIYGDIHVSFFTASVLKKNIVNKRGIITKSCNNIVMQINDTIAADHFQELGLHRDAFFQENSSAPLLLEYSTTQPPLVRNILRVTPEGYLVCGGDMPEMASLTIVTSNDLAIQETLNQMLDEIMQLEDIEGVCFVSCFGRAFMLGINIDIEIEAIRAKLGRDIPFLFSYSGGEFCPLPDVHEQQHNQFHNFSAIACVFQKGGCP